MPRSDNKLCIAIGPIHLIIESPIDWVIREIVNNYNPFLCHSDSGFKLIVLPKDRGISYNISDLQVTYKNGYVFARRSDFDLSISMNGNYAEGQILEGSLPGLVTMLKFVFTVTAFKTNGLFLHAGATVKNRKGWVFPGHSGAGKTTLVKRLNKHKLLNDETTLVIQQNNGWYVYSTPFSGELAQHPELDSAPLHALAFPEKNKGMKLTGISHTEAVYRIIQNVIGWGGEDWGNSMLDLAVDLSKSCKSFVLSYPINSDPDILFKKVDYENYPAQ
ncbi:MAG: hypothetical protein P9X24_18925 [Candidatus Hatepunaea meridiana]|nr:hypothetical protein [Candidatus Hatepunaea meridiana]